MLLLTQGESFRKTDFQYVVFSFNLNAPRNQVGSIRPTKWENMPRFWPNRIGMLGRPGNAILIAHRTPTGAEFMMGYIGWDGYPVFWHRALLWRYGEPLLWHGQPGQEIWYAQKHIDFTLKMMGRRTVVTAVLTKRNEKEYHEARSKREAALNRSKSELRKHAKREAERKRREKARKEAEQRKKWHADEILTNLQIIHLRLHRAEEWIGELEQRRAKMAAIHEELNETVLTEEWI